MTRDSNGLPPNIQAWLDAQWSSPNKYGFALNCGRRVLIDAFTLEETYAGKLGGATSEAENDGRIGRKLKAAEKIWGVRPTHLIRPVSRVEQWPDGRQNVLLPTYCYSTWLTSKAIGNDYGGSELVVIWFGARDMERSIASVVELACRELPWESLAKDFDY